MPVTGTVVIDAPRAREGQCGEGTFAVSKCRHDPVRGRLQCKG